MKMPSRKLNLPPMMKSLHERGLAVQLVAVLLLMISLISPAVAAASAPQNSVTDNTASTSADVGRPIGPSISANPAAVEIYTGSGEAQRFLLKQFGADNDHGVRFGGVWLADCNWLMTGGEKPGALSCNSALVLDNHIDLKKLTGWWTGGSFGAEFLQLNANPTNGQAGSVQGYNSTPGADPLTRSELYQLWIRQQFLHARLIIRVGKMTPSNDFGNVLRPVPTQDAASFIPAVSGLLYTPTFTNPTLYGASPGFYNSAGGVVANVVPVKWWYVNYGAFDGNLARGVQTGERGPIFNGYYFQIAETGFAWRLGQDRLPGEAGVGIWRQTGVLQGPPGVSEQGTDGVYAFGSQRIWYRNPGHDHAGVSTFLQVGHNESKTLPVHQFVGGGFTGFGLVPSRANDSAGIGLAWSQLNPNIFKRNSELMVQSYYQTQIAEGVYLQPTLTYIPTPGASPGYNSAWAATLRLTVLF